METTPRNTSDGPQGRRRTAVMADVAKLAGVSHQTVSRVLHDHPNVRPTTRDRVLTAVAGGLATLRGWPRLDGDLTERPLVVDRPAGVERLVADLVTRII